MNKTRLPLSAVLTTALLSGFVSAAYGFGEFERGSLLLDTTARATYDSYFIGSRDPSAGDYYLSLHPNLKYDRKAGLAEISGYLGVDILRYDKNTSYNTENVSGSINLRLPDTGYRWSGNVSLSYVESENVDFNVLDRIKERATSAAANFNYQLGLKMALAENFSFTHIDRSQYSDQTLLHNDVSYRYSNFLDDTSLRLTESFDRTKSNGHNAANVDLDQTSNSVSGGITRHIYGPLSGEAVLGYRFLDRNRSETYTNKSNFNGMFYSLNLHGPFLPPRYFPKIESSASVTYEQSQNPGINDVGEKTVTGDVRLAWQARPETKISFDANRSVELTATDLSVDSSSLNLSVSESIGYNTTAGASVGYIWRTYPNTGRSDDTLTAGLNVNHHFNKYWSGGISYEYQDNTSKGEHGPSMYNWGIDPFGINPHDFSRHLVNIFVTNEF